MLGRTTRFLVRRKYGEWAAKHVRSRRNEIGAYANALCKAYCEAYGPGQPVLFKMKELWGFLADSMPDGKKLRKKVHKVQRLDGYQRLMREMFPEIDPL